MSGPRDRSGRQRSQRGAVAYRGTCPVCRRARVRVRQVDGKVGVHGKTAASPRGCAGAGQPPLRTGADGAEREQTGGTVLGFTAPGTRPVPAQPPESPEVELVSRREPDLGLRVRDPEPLPPTA